VQTSVLQKYCTLCESLNVDPLTQHTLSLVVILLSRHAQRINMARSYLRKLQSDGSLVAWDTASDLSFLQQKLLLSSDWALLLAFAEFVISDEARAELAVHPVLVALQASLLSASVITSTTLFEFVMRCLMYIAPAGTPSPKMLECLLGQHQILCLAPTLAQELQDVLALLQTNSTVPPVETVRRIRLRYIVKSVHNASALSYELSLNSWCSNKKFTTTTSLNVQRLLYFINAQTCAVDVSLFPDYFTPAMTRQLTLQLFTTININPINAVIGSLRLYTNNIQHLINFRMRCLDGLNVKALQASHPASLSPAAQRAPAAPHSTSRRTS